MNNINNNFYNIATKSLVRSSILLIFSLSVITSCTKDVLDKAPTNSFSDNSVWNDINLIEQYVNYTYHILPTGNTGPGGFTTSSRRLALAGVDELHGRGSNFLFINQGNITPSSLGVDDFWAAPIGLNYWSVITNCNLYLSKIAGTSFSDVERINRMTGEMTFLRAYSYFRLVALYGGVPLVTKPFGLNDDFKVTRNSYDECMNFVISELDVSAGLLPLTYTPTQYGRITKGAVLSIKSRALLYMASPLNNSTNELAKWQAAAAAAKAVIDLNLYSLFPNYKTLFLLANSYNSEVIWSRPYNSTLLPELSSVHELWQYPNGYSGYGQIHPYQDFVDSYETLNGKLPKDDPTYDPQNPYLNRDPRFYMTILYDGAPFKDRDVETFLPGGKDSREGPISSWNATETGYYLRKFIDESITNPNTLNQGNSPWIFCRYAEILLNYAEAEYFLGDEPTCREYINMIRNRTGVNMPPVMETGASLLARLQNERKIELSFEEQRWFDIRRWKIAPVIMNSFATKMEIRKDLATGKKTYTIQNMYQRSFPDKNYLLPIPQPEIEKDASLVQNPGY